MFDVSVRMDEFGSVVGVEPLFMFMVESLVSWLWVGVPEQAARATIPASKAPVKSRFMVCAFELVRGS
jgi:hypothetical protein